MSLQEKITAICRNWSRKLAQDLKESLERALKDGQPKRSGQQASLTFGDEVVVDEQGNANIKIIATDEYWINIEDGRGKGEKRPPSKALGAKWQTKNGINPNQILKEIQINAKKKYSRLTKTGKRLSKPAMELSFDEAAKRLSYIFAGAISRNGIEPKPFVDRVITESRLRELTNKISEAMGQEVTAQLDFNNEFKNIKIKI